MGEILRQCIERRFKGVERRGGDGREIRLPTDMVI